MNLILENMTKFSECFVAIQLSIHSRAIEPKETTNGIPSLDISMSLKHDFVFELVTQAARFDISERVWRIFLTGPVNFVLLLYRQLCFLILLPKCVR